MSYKTIFENEHFIIVDKKANVLSVPSRLGKSDPRACLGHVLEENLKSTIFPVHRLDFEVQGLIMYAKTPEAQKAGNLWFEQKTISKIYSALTTSLKSGPTEFVIGELQTWKCQLLRGKKRAFESAHGKNSITHARLLKVGEKGIFHWELEPVTGRSHQLRYELFRHHHPIMGDTLYSSPSSFSEEGIALRAFKIDFSKTPNSKNFFLPEKIEIEKF
jgi:tRNA pseudouridine32 synthase/23S rRNA pseudouridine746 synthase